MKLILEHDAFYFDPETLKELNAIIAMFDTVGKNEFDATINLWLSGHEDDDGSANCTSKLEIRRKMPDIQEPEQEIEQEKIEGEKKDESA
jgi:hypothetical protein